MILVDDQKMPWIPEMSVADLLKKLPHTEFCSVIRLNGTLVSSPAFETTMIPDGAVIHLLPIVAGG